MAPWADVNYFADSQWWTWHKDREDFKSFAGQKCSIMNSGANIDDGNVHILRNRDYPNNGMGISLDPERLVTGSNSGHQALNLAVLTGVSTIILLGFDGDVEKNGKRHWFGNHPTIEPDSVYPLIRQSFKMSAKAVKAAGVRVINCSPGTSITAFERMPLEDALAI